MTFLAEVERFSIRENVLWLSAHPATTSASRDDPDPLESTELAEAKLDTDAHKKIFLNKKLLKMDHSEAQKTSIYI